MKQPSVNEVAPNFTSGTNEWVENRFGTFLISSGPPRSDIIVLVVQESAGEVRQSGARASVIPGRLLGETKAGHSSMRAPMFVTLLTNAFKGAQHAMDNSCDIRGEAHLRRDTRDVLHESISLQPEFNASVWPN